MWDKWFQSSTTWQLKGLSINQSETRQWLRPEEVTMVHWDKNKDQLFDLEEITKMKKMQKLYRIIFPSPSKKYLNHNSPVTLPSAKLKIAIPKSSYWYTFERRFKKREKKSLGPWNFVVMFSWWLDESPNLLNVGIWKKCSDILWIQLSQNIQYFRS